MKNFLYALITFFVFAGVAQSQTLYRWVDKDGKVYYTDQPPPPTAKKIQEKKLDTGSSIETSGLTFEQRKAVENFPVTLYTTVDCASECTMARDLLKRRGSPFSEKSLRTAEDAIAFKKTFGSAETTIPSLSVGNQKLKGFNESAWHGLLDAAGYPRNAPVVQRREAPAPAAAPAAPDPGATPAPASPPPAAQ